MRLRLFKQLSQVSLQCNADTVMINARLTAASALKTISVLDMVVGAVLCRELYVHVQDDQSCSKLVHWTATVDSEWDLPSKRSLKVISVPMGYYDREMLRQTNTLLNGIREIVSSLFHDRGLVTWLSWLLCLQFPSFKLQRSSEFCVTRSRSVTRITSSNLSIQINTVLSQMIFAPQDAHALGDCVETRCPWGGATGGFWPCSCGTLRTFWEDVREHLTETATPL